MLTFPRRDKICFILLWLTPDDRSCRERIKDLKLWAIVYASQRSANINIILFNRRMRKTPAFQAFHIILWKNNAIFKCFSMYFVTICVDRKAPSTANLVGGNTKYFGILFSCSTLFPSSLSQTKSCLTIGLTRLGRASFHTSFWRQSSSLRARLNSSKILERRQKIPDFSHGLASSEQIIWFEFIWWPLISLSISESCKYKHVSLERVT